MDRRPSVELPWSHLTPDEFVEAKKMYGEYWSRVVSHTNGRILKQLVFHMNYVTGACYAGAETIGKETKKKNGDGLSRKTVSRAVKEFRTMGVFEVVDYRDIGPTPPPRLREGGRSNRYVIDLDKYALRHDGEFTAVAKRPTDFFVTLGGMAPMSREHPKYRYLYPTIGPADLPDIPENELPPLFVKEFISRVDENSDTSDVDIADAERKMERWIRSYTAEVMLLSIFRFGFFTEIHQGPILTSFMNYGPEIVQDIEKDLIERERRRK
ncbi:MULTISPECIES: hypothetical protein [Parafrankia]|nr:MULTISPECIES: hypothetical protein [Parafrankia]MBE3199723.1 hypothetical protein [Parafrankia sp. CH37]